MPKAYNILYKTTNTENGKIYIGAHTTDNLEDGYLGSGVYLKKAIKKYGKDKFKREIINLFDDKETLFLIEREFVDKQFVKRRDTYNSEIGGSGGKIWTDEMKQQMSIIKKGYTAWNKGQTKETNEILKSASDNMKQWHVDNPDTNRGINNPMYGVNIKDIMTEEDYNNWKKNISKANKGKVRTKEQRKRYSESASKRIWLVNEKGELIHTTNTNDARLNDNKWQRGRKWKLKNNTTDIIN